MSDSKDKKQETENNASQQNTNQNISLIPNPNNNPVIKEVNELLMDQDQIKRKVSNYNKDCIELELSIPESLTQSQYPIKFLLIISMEFPKQEPELYCITKFSYPHIYDGRNLLDDVLKKKWKRNVHSLDLIINRIPRFIIEFNNSLEDGYLLLVGKYMIDHLYSLDKVKELPIFHQNVKQDEKVKNKMLIEMDDKYEQFQKEFKQKLKNTKKNCEKALLQLKESKDTEIEKMKQIIKDLNEEIQDYKSQVDSLEYKISLYKEKIINYEKEKKSQMDQNELLRVLAGKLNGYVDMLSKK